MPPGDFKTKTMTQKKYICWLRHGRIDTVKCTAETDKYVFTEEYGKLSKSTSTYRVRSSMMDACNTMRHYYETRIEVLNEELKVTQMRFDYWKDTYMI